MTSCRVFIAVCAGGVEIGRVNAFAPDYSKAKVAAAKLFALFDRQSLIDPTDTSGRKPVSTSRCSDVTLRSPVAHQSDRHFRLETGDYVTVF